MKASIAVALVGLVLAGAHGQAEGFEIIGSMENQSAGELLLTDTKCGAKGKERGLIIMATDNGGGVTSSGCAHPLPPGRVFVSWNSGTHTVLPMDGWAPNAGTTLEFQSLSNAELDALNARLVWFEQSREPSPRGRYLIYDDEPPAPARPARVYR